MLLLALHSSVTFATPLAQTLGVQKITLLVHGDSLSAAYGMERDDGWVALLQKAQPQLNVVNSSISGETTSGGKQRLPKLMETYRPDILILELGANDALRGQNLKTTERNLQAMIDRCLAAQCTPVLLGIRLPTNYGPAYERMLQKMYADLAEKNAVAFDPFFIEPVALDPDLMQLDGLHPNAQAQVQIYQRVWALIQPLLESRNAGL
ncbi:arylesterase [Thiomicrorhabdus sp. zzn3]|uniref:arylesterase n=1 Tax=Thiomicrorhabdus sp. zzn3 TaxID=3039775 RepID=UPI0024367635|nr:arylesterase [Thiomicrorhabdus sp. zzn3]MDG6778400.1 arylesterase [Thiomicrorhabdus sp. zzn3]